MSRPPQSVLDTVEGEISFFRAITRSRPVGRHRYFRVLAMRHAIQSETGRWADIQDIWAKLNQHYNLEALEKHARRKGPCISQLQAD